MTRAQNRVPAGGKVDALPHRRTRRGLPHRGQPQRRHVPAAQPPRPFAGFRHAPGNQQRRHFLVPRTRVVHLRQRAEHLRQRPAEVVVPDRRVGAVGKAEPDRRREHPPHPRVAVQVDARMPRRLRQAQHIADRADGVADRPFPEQPVLAHAPLHEGVETHRSVDRKVHELFRAQCKPDHADGRRAQRLPVRGQRFMDVGIDRADQPRRRKQQVILHVAPLLPAKRPGVENQVVGRRHVQRKEAVLQRLRADLRELLDRVGVVSVGVFAENRRGGFRVPHLTSHRVPQRQVFGRTGDLRMLIGPPGLVIHPAGVDLPALRAGVPVRLVGVVDQPRAVGRADVQPQPLALGVLVRDGKRPSQPLVRIPHDRLVAPVLEAPFLPTQLPDRLDLTRVIEQQRSLPLFQPDLSRVHGQPPSARGRPWYRPWAGRTGSLHRARCRPPRPDLR